MISLRLSGVRARSGPKKRGRGILTTFGHCLALSFCPVLCVLPLLCVCSGAQKGKTAQKVAATFDQDTPSRSRRSRRRRRSRQDMQLIFKFKSHFLRPSLFFYFVPAVCKLRAACPALPDPRALFDYNLAFGVVRRNPVKDLFVVA